MPAAPHKRVIRVGGDLANPVPRVAIQHRVPAAIGIDSAPLKPVPSNVSPLKQLLRKARGHLEPFRETRPAGLAVRVLFKWRLRSSVNVRQPPLTVPRLARPIGEAVAAAPPVRVVAAVAVEATAAADTGLDRLPATIAFGPRRL